MLVRVVDGELRVANTGAPLDAAGVAALASLRASAKRDDEGSVGRFGVGFAAVLAVSREPRVVTHDGHGVRFSASATAEAVAGLPGPAAELARRAGQLPVLRLAWPVTEEPPPAGFDTEVRLPLSAAFEPPGEATDLLLALPDLVEITVGGKRVTRTDESDGRVRVGDRAWLLARATGTLDDDEAGTQAVEQRGRRDWSLTWALPLDVDGTPDPAPADVLHAPTPSTERLSLPARLIATVPLEPDRRRVRDTAAARRVLAAAGPAYLDLVRAVPGVDRVRLVPAPGFPQSPTDAVLRDTVVDALRDGEWLPCADGRELVARRAEWLDLPDAGPLASVLGPEFPELAAPDALAGVPVGVLDQLGLRRLGPAALADRLLPVEQPAAWWHAVYDALAPAADTVPGLLDELRALPVPLADGRTIAGPRSAVIPVDDTADLLAGLDLPGLHLADPAAAHPLLERLGATAADPSSLLELPALRDAVDRSVDDAEAGLDTMPLARVVLRLLTAGAGVRAGALALPDENGDPARADELLLPDAALRPLLAPDAPVGVLHPDVADGFPREALVAAGVLDGFTLVVDDEPLGPDHDLHDEDQWWDGLDAPPARVAAVRDLDLVDDDAWPGALALLGADRDTRAAVLTDGHTRWWLRRNVVLGGRAPGYWRLPSAGDLAALYEPVHGVDEALLRAVGVRSGLAVDDTDAAADLLDRLADPARTPDAATVLAAHESLTDAVADGRVDPADLALPERVRVLDGSVVPVDDVVVLDKPWLAAVLPADELVAGGDPAALAELLDLPLASDYVAATLEPGPGGRVVAWSALPDVVVASHTVGAPVPTGELVVHDELAVVVTRPAVGRTAVPAWPDTDGRWHATDPLRALIGVLADPPAPGSDDG